FLLCSVESTKMLTAEATLFPILEVLVNSLNLATESGAAGKRFICTELRGPLVDLYFFSVENIKHCTLHIVNL
ncbi:unnamed protein product, partial [Effrenium voratum]